MAKQKRSKRGSANAPSSSKSPKPGSNAKKKLLTTSPEARAYAERPSVIGSIPPRVL